MFLPEEPRGQNQAHIAELGNHRFCKEKLSKTLEVTQTVNFLSLEVCKLRSGKSQCHVQQRREASHCPTVWSGLGSGSCLATLTVHSTCPTVPGQAGWEGCSGAELGAIRSDGQREAQSPASGGEAWVEKLKAPR